MKTVLMVYFLGWACTFFWYVLNETDPDDIHIARFVFWPLFAVRGLWRSWKLAWRK